MIIFVAVAYVNLGTALIASGRCEEAIAILRQASKLDGTGVKDRREHENAKVSALLQLGALYSDQGRLHNALAVYREAAANLPKYYPPQVNLLAETIVLSKMQNVNFYHQLNQSEDISGRFYFSRRNLHFTRQLFLSEMMSLDKNEIRSVKIHSFVPRLKCQDRQMRLLCLKNLISCSR